MANLLDEEREKGKATGQRPCSSDEEAELRYRNRHRYSSTTELTRYEEWIVGIRVSCKQGICENLKR